MSKNRKPQAQTLAMEVLREEVRRTRFWKAAFIVAFSSLTAILIDRIAGKDGTR